MRVWVCTIEINIVKNFMTVETALKHFVLSFARQSHFEAYIVKCFALVKCLVLLHSSQICGEMSVDLLANRKHLNGVFGKRQKCD